MVPSAFARLPGVWRWAAWGCRWTNGVAPNGVLQSEVLCRLCSLYMKRVRWAYPTQFIRLGLESPSIAISNSCWDNGSALLDTGHVAKAKSFALEF